MALLPGDSPEKELTFIQKSELVNHAYIESTEATAVALRLIAKKFSEVDARLQKLETNNQALLEIQQVLHQFETGG